MIMNIRTNMARRNCYHQSCYIDWEWEWLLMRE